jgi:hypothetical protein
MRLSVLMPFRNAASTLPEALESIAAALSQRGSDSWELVAVNHASDDESCDQVTTGPFASLPLRLVHASPELSIGGVLELGRSHCKGIYIARMDADDRMHPRRLCEDVAYLDAHPDVSVVACRIEPFTEEDDAPALPRYAAWQNQILSPDEIAKEIWIEQPFCHPATTFRAKALERVGGYRDGNFPEDYDLFMRLHVSGAHLHKRPEVHHHWRQHQGQSTFRDPRYHRDAFARVKAWGLRDFFSLDKRPFVIAGAGREGGRMARALAEIDLKPRWFFDVSEKKIGSVRHGVDVLSYAQLEEKRDACPELFCIGAVGTSGSGAIVRNRLTQTGFIEGESFVLVA